MIALFSLLFSNHALFVGKWTANLVINHKKSNETGRFDVVIHRLGKLNNMSAAFFTAHFKNSSRINFLRSSYNFFGYVSNDNSTYSMFSIYPDLHKQFNETMKIFSNFLAASNFTEPYQFLDIYNKLTKTYFSENITIIGLNAQIIHTDALAKKQFNKNTILAGILHVPFGKIQLNAREYDYILFQRESRIFLVFVSLFIVFNFYGWISMTRNFQNPAKVTQLSLLSFLLHSIFDYSYILIFIDNPPLINSLMPLYIFIIAVMALFYLICEMPHLGLLLRNKCSLTTNEETWSTVAFFFIFFFINSFVSNINSNLIFKVPKVVVPLMYSFFLPQIVFNVSNPEKHKKDLTFIILTTISRLFPVCYFGMYPNNIEGTYFHKSALACVAYLLMQTFVLILQNIFGGDFFIPIEMRSQFFNYETIRPPPESECAICFVQIEDSDAAMTTPCNHYFHRGCLRRWLQEQLVCPVCRANLPQIVTNEPDIETLI